MVEENRENFNTLMHPIKPMAVYTKKQECCQAFAVVAGNPTTMVNMVQTGMIHAVATGVMRDASCKWKRIPKPDQSCNQWKEHFNDAFNELKELNVITMYSMGYGTSNIT